MVTCYMAVRLGPVFAAVPFVEVQNSVHRSKKEKNRNGFDKNRNLQSFLLNHLNHMHLLITVIVNMDMALVYATLLHSFHWDHVTSNCGNRPV